jgi:hypothetical protein
MSPLEKSCKTNKKSKKAATQIPFMMKLGVAASLQR